MQSAHRISRAKLEHIFESLFPVYLLVHSFALCNKTLLVFSVDASDAGGVLIRLSVLLKISKIDEDNDSNPNSRRMTTNATTKALHFMLKYFK